MILRKLKAKDASLMLEWMHDENVVRFLKAAFSEKTIEDCFAFIESAQNDKTNLNLAIANEQDEYMGTVSLKHIQNGTAEFAIAIRSCAMGTGCSKYAMERILEIGFGKLNLSSIYWCVSFQNLRAIRFYDKNGNKRVPPELICDLSKRYNLEEMLSYYWYLVSKNDINSNCSVTKNYPTIF